MNSRHRAFTKFAMLLSFWSFLTLGAASLVSADIVGTAVPAEQISPNGVNLGTLTMTAPTSTASGVTVSGTFVGSANFDPNDTVMWVQMITTNQPYAGQPASPASYFDPAPTDPLNTNYPGGGALQYPFYYNVPPGNAMQNVYLYTNNQIAGNSTARFSDTPSRGNTANAVWDAELSLVCWDRPLNTLEILWSGTYGFSTGNDMLTNAVRGITQLGTVNNGVFSNPAPVKFNQAALNAAGFNNNANIPANTWTIVPADCSVPSPSIVCSLLSSAVAFVIFALRQTRRGPTAHAASVLAA
jgi:hypothetical protein